MGHRTLSLALMSAIISLLTLVAFSPVLLATTPAAAADTAQQSVLETSTPTLAPQSMTPPRRPTMSATPAAMRPTTDMRLYLPIVFGGPAATATRPPWSSVFWADRYTLNPGECTTLHWQVENVTSVFLNGQAVTGSGTRLVCPVQTSPYTLRITSDAGTQEFTIHISVSRPGEAAIDFTADSYRITAGQCTVLRWAATGAHAVYLNDQGVAGVASQQVCPTANTDYTLRVESTSGAVTTHTISIVVSDGPVVDMRFWADQYSMSVDTCTMLYWDVRNVHAVFLDDEGVAGRGSRRVCPEEGFQYFTLRAVTADDLEAYLSVALMVGELALAPNEVIAQGVIKEIARQDDLDPVTPGEQDGYRLIIEGIKPLFTGTDSWSQAAVTLRLPQEFLDMGEGDLMSWPLNSGQSVEFRAGCEGATCTLKLTLNSYLYLRSP